MIIQTAYTFSTLKYHKKIIQSCKNRQIKYIFERCASHINVLIQLQSFTKRTYALYDKNIRYTYCQNTIMLI